MAEYEQRSASQQSSHDAIRTAQPSYTPRVSAPATDRAQDRAPGGSIFEHERRRGPLRTGPDPASPTKRSEAPSPASGKEEPARTATEVVRRHLDSLAPDEAWVYVDRHQERFIEALQRAVGTIILPSEASVRWQPDGLATGFGEALRDVVETRLFDVLPSLLHPADPWYVIDQHRSVIEGTPGVVVDGRAAKGSMLWNPLVATALGVEVCARLRESLARMLPRFLVQVRAKQAARIAVTDLVPSHPMDRVTARMLCGGKLLHVKPEKLRDATHASSGSESFANGIRYVDWRWLGEGNRRLWNWIEVLEPRDATPEDVAATLFSGTRLGKDQPSALAYGITGARPFFRLPPSWARMFDGAREYAPSGVDTPHVDDALVLAESSHATDAAIAQAADERKFDKRGIPLAPDRQRLSEVLARSQRQLERAQEALPRSHVEHLIPSLRWVMSHREHLTAIPSGRLVGLTPVIEGQQQILFDAVGAIAELAPSLAKEPEGGPIADVLRAYAVTAGESHLVDTARASLARAHAKRGQLTFALLDRSIRESHSAAAELRASEQRMHWDGVAASGEAWSLQERLVAMRAAQATGKDPDPDQVQLLAMEMKQHAFVTRVKALYLHLHSLMEEVRDSMQGIAEGVAAAFGKELREIPPLLSRIITELHESVLEPMPGLLVTKLREGGGSTGAWARAAAIRSTLELSEPRFDEIVKRHDLKNVTSRALERIESQRLRTILVKVAALIAVSVVGNVAGGIVAGSVRGAALADIAVSTAGLARTASGAYRAGTVAGLATEATVNALGQAAIMGDGGVGSWVDDFVSSGMVLAALRPLHLAASRWTAGAKLADDASLWDRTAQRGGLALKHGTVVTAELITAGAVQYVYQRARHGVPDEETAMSWALQGGSMVVGRFIAGRVAGIEQRASALAELGAQLRVRARRVKALAGEVERRGGSDDALELLAQHHQLLVEEQRTLEHLVAHPDSRIRAETVHTLEAANRTERMQTSDAAFSTLPLRLAGLTPDDASGRVWSGATEDIAIALHQAERSGITVRVLDHDIAARRWHVSVGGDVLTILETSIHGRPRAARDGADQRQAQRYAEAAEAMQAKWEEKTKRELDGRAVIELDHLQVGYSIAGVMNQATLPAGGEGLNSRLVVYEHAGTLTGRGRQHLGQQPAIWDAPGIRGSEQADPTAEWISSDEHRRSLEIGRVELQTPTYRGRVVRLEVRPKDVTFEDWAAPARALRVTIQDPVGARRAFYVDRFDNAGGLGPADLAGPRAVTANADQLEAMLASGQLLRGDDVDYVRKLRPGRVLVWGGSPTGAWAAEPTVTPRSKMTVLGDIPRAANDWPKLMAEYEAVMAALGRDSTNAELVQRKASLEGLIAQAHGGMTIRRNRKAGATYEKPIGTKGPVQIEFGSPTKLEPLPDGRVMVTVGEGATLKSSIYDQVVVAHGQDPGAPGGPGALLGAPAPKPDAEVPESTIQLTPIFAPAGPDGQREILGLESVDPPGIRLVGAAFASRRMASWVRKADRDAFVREVDRMALEGARTRDHGPVSGDSNRVSPGIEVQRDRLPRANEVLGARVYRLPGPQHTLELDRDPAKWDEQVRTFFTIQLRADHTWVRVERTPSSVQGAIAYRVWVGDNEVGTLKILDRKSVEHEESTRALFTRARLKHVSPLRARGKMSLSNSSSSAVLVDAGGPTLASVFDTLPDDPSARRRIVESLKRDLASAARGLAEVHVATRQGLVPQAAKQREVDMVLEANLRPGGARTNIVRQALGVEFEDVRVAVESVIAPEFLAADVPHTAVHRGSSVHAFAKPREQSGPLTLAGLESVKRTESSTGASDLVALLRSVDAAGHRMTSVEIAELHGAITRAYSRQFGSNGALEVSVRWFEVSAALQTVGSDPAAFTQLRGKIRERSSR